MSETKTRYPFKCAVCGHEWLSPLQDGPKRCPKHACNAVNWKTGKSEVKRYQHTCIRCGHEWESTKENPATCAACKRYDWNTPRKRDPITKKWLVPKAKNKNRGV